MGTAKLNVSRSTLYWLALLVEYFYNKTSKQSWVKQSTSSTKEKANEYHIYVLSVETQMAYWSKSLI